MANFATLGMTGEPFPVRIERGKIMEFAAATRAGDPAYWTDVARAVPAQRGPADRAVP